MAKTSSIERNNKRIRLAKSVRARATRLKAIANDKSLPPEERFAARLKLRNAAQRIAGPHAQSLRADRAPARPSIGSSSCRASRCANLASNGQIPGMVKSSW